MIVMEVVEVGSGSLTSISNIKSKFLQKPKPMFENYFPGDFSPNSNDRNDFI